VVQFERFVSGRAFRHAKETTNPIGFSRCTHQPIRSGQRLKSFVFPDYGIAEAMP
jgi:hypothetical protein